MEEAKISDWYVFIIVLQMTLFLFTLLLHGLLRSIKASVSDRTSVEPGESLPSLAVIEPAEQPITAESYRDIATEQIEDAVQYVGE